jgi:hypothetical protein
VQRRLDLAVAVTRAGEVEGLVTDGVGDSGPIAALEADVNNAGMVVAEVADRRHAKLAARAASRRR